MSSVSHGSARSKHERSERNANHMGKHTFALKQEHLS